MVYPARPHQILHPFMQGKKLIRHIFRLLSRNGLAMVAFAKPPQRFYLVICEFMKHDPSLPARTVRPSPRQLRF